MYDGETEPGTTMVALTRDDTHIVIRDVPTHIFTTCVEEEVDAETGRRGFLRVQKQL